MRSFSGAADTVERTRFGKGIGTGTGERQLTGTFGTERVSVPRARIVEEDGRASEWRSRALPRYQRLTRKAEALIASVYLSGTNTRRGETRAVRALPGCCEQGRCEPGVAQGEGRLGRLVQAVASRMRISFG